VEEPIVAFTQSLCSQVCALWADTGKEERNAGEESAWHHVLRRRGDRTQVGGLAEVEGSKKEGLMVGTGEPEDYVMMKVGRDIGKGKVPSLEVLRPLGKGRKSGAEVRLAGGEGGESLSLSSPSPPQRDVLTVAAEDAADGKKEAEEATSAPKKRKRKRKKKNAN